MDSAAMSFIDDSAKVDDDDIADGDEVADLVLLEKDESQNHANFVDDKCIDADGDDDDLSMYRRLDNERPCAAAINLLEASTAELMSDVECIDDESDMDVVMSDEDMSLEEIRIRDIVNNLSVEVSRNANIDLKIQQLEKNVVKNVYINNDVDNDDLEADYDNVKIESDDMEIDDDTNVIYQVDDSDSDATTDAVQEPIQTTDDIDGEGLMAGNITENGLKKLKMAYAAMVKSLAVLDTGDGECVFVSIVNALVLKEHSKAMEVYVPTDSDARLRMLVGGNDQLCKILLEERRYLKNLSKAKLFETFYRLNVKLSAVGVAINLFTMKDKFSYSFTKMSADITDSSASKQVKCIRTLVRFATPCLLGCKTFRLNEPSDTVKKIKIVNLVAIMNAKENHVTYAADTAMFYKSLTADDKAHPMQLSSVQSVYVCPSCHNCYLSKRKYRYTEHEKKCPGYGRTTYSFNSENADIKLLTFEKDKGKTLQHPFSIYYDVETRTGFADIDDAADNFVGESFTKMAVMSYCVGLVFSEDLRAKGGYEPVYEYRSIVQTKAELSTIHLPEFIRRWKSSRDVNLWRKSIENIVAGNPHALVHHMALEIMLMVKWTKRYFHEMVIPVHRNLSIEDKQKYFRLNSSVKVWKCCICSFQLHSSSDRLALIDSDRMKFEIRKEFVRESERYCMGSSEDLKPLPEEIGEQDYVEMVRKALHVYALQGDLEELQYVQRNGSTSGYSTVVTTQQYPELSKAIEYLTELGMKTVDELREKLVSSNDLESVCRNKRLLQQDYGWGCELLRYEYRRQIKGNWDFSDDFLTKIHLFIQDTAVVHHDHVSGKIFGRAHDSCNKAVQLAIKTLPICVFAHNANKFDIKFIIAGINLSEWGTANINLTGKSSASVESVQIGYEVVFRDSLKFFQDSLDNLGKSASADEVMGIKKDTLRFVKNHSYLSKVFDKLSVGEKLEGLELLTKKGAIPYDLFRTGGELSCAEFPPIQSFISSLKMKNIDESDYENVKKIWNVFQLRNLDDLNALYNASDVIIMANVVNKRLHKLFHLFGYEPKHFASTTGFSSAALAKHSRQIITNPQNNDVLMAFENAVRGGYSAVMQRLSFDTSIIPGPKTTPYIWNPVKEEMERFFFYCKTVKVDENNQYGFSMSKKLPTDSVQRVTFSTNDDDLTQLNDYLQQIMASYDEETADIGYLVVVDLSPPTSDKVIEIAMCEAYIPIFERTSLSVADMSTFYLQSHTTFHAKSGKPNKITPTLKTHCTLRPRIREYMFIESLKYCVEELAWTLTKVHKIYKFRQSNWMAGYVTNNQHMRQKADTKIESDFYKQMNNKCYGGRMTKGAQNKLEAVIDYGKEYSRFDDDEPKQCETLFNPFATSQSMTVAATEKYTKAAAVDAAGASDIAMENLQHDLSRVERKRKHERKMKRKLHQPLKPSTQVQEALMSPYLQNITQYNDAQSIAGVISENKKSLKPHSRFIGCKILAFAKLQIATFIHSIVKLFHPALMTMRVRTQLMKYNVVEVQPSMVLTDTDSCSWMFIMLGDMNKPRFPENDIKEMLEKLLITELRPRFDLSDDYFKKYDMHAPHERKQMGLYAFENINGINVTVGVNPKEYIEVYNDTSINKKHKGLKRNTVGMDYPMYADRVRSMKENASIEKRLAKRFMQKRLQAVYGEMSQVSIDKVSFGKLNDKNYYFTDGITSLPHGHPLLKEVYEHRVGKTEAEIQLDGVVGERLENAVIGRHRRLFVTNRIFNSKIPKEGCTVREYLLNVSNIDKFFSPNY